MTDFTVYVDGRWSAGDGAEYASVDPSRGATFTTWRLASVAQADAAVAAAGAAFGSWSRTGPGERAAVLRRFADLLEKNHEELAQLVVTEVGSPISLARTLQTATPVANLRWAADVAESGPRGGYRERLVPLEGPARVESELLRVPIGVVAAMTPYNYPVNMIAWKVGPALAAGCTVVLLPSPRGSRCSVEVVRLAEEAGVPPGILNLVPGGPDVGQRLAAHPDVDLVSFTGSNAVGAAVAEAAAPLHTKVVLELGGKSPTVVLPGADLDKAVGPSMLRFCRNAGQGCGATTRILVHRSQYDDFVAASIAFLHDEVPVGDPRDEATEIGPLISAEHRERVEGYLRRAVDGGARILVGGGRPDGPGYYLEPTLVADVGAGDEICQEELFAPVATVMPYDTVDEAVELANDSRYGLNALVWGEPTEARDVALRLETGTVAINGGGGARPDVPWTGFKRSGVGSEMGLDGFGEFFRVRHLQWPEE